MKAKRTLFLLSIVTLMLLTGCWDARELKERAIVLGTGLDKGKNGKYLVSAQIVIPTNVPSGQNSGGKGNPFYVEAATGESLQTAMQKLQTKLSREAFLGHRDAIFIGEEMARQGIAEVLDEYTRNPEVRLRTDVFVVKGSDARHFLELPYPLENISVEAALKELRAVGGTGDVTLRNFLVASTSDEGVGMLPVIQISSSSNRNNEKGFQIVGTAIFKDFRLVGFLGTNQTNCAQWITGNLKKIDITTFVSEGNGNVSMHLEKFKREIQPVFQGSNMKFIVTLTGSGDIKENNTNLDLTMQGNLEILQDALSKEAEKHVKQTIAEVQKKYGTDILGFDEIIQNHPQKWKTLKKNWSKTFSNANVSVKVKLRIVRVGITGPSLQLKDHDIRR